MPSALIEGACRARVVISATALVRRGSATAIRQPVVQVVHAISDRPGTKANENRKFTTQASFCESALAQASVRCGLGRPKDLGRRHDSQPHLLRDTPG